MSKADDLLLDICNCSVASGILMGKLSDSPCYKIVKWQEAHEGSCQPNSWQLPEPWVGNIETARILYVSSNPSFTAIEKFPCLKDDDSYKRDFFVNRFENPDYTRDFRVRLKEKGANGSNESRIVKFWSELNKTTHSLFGADLVAGRDFVFTEIVHCKSKHEAHVSKALKECGGKYFHKILDCSNAEIIIFVGCKSRKFASKLFKTEISRTELTRDLFKNRIVGCLNHPSCWGQHKNDPDCTEAFKNLNWK